MALAKRKHPVPSPHDVIGDGFGLSLTEATRVRSRHICHKD